jgi:Tfp pilus assembly protein PilO
MAAFLIRLRWQALRLGEQAGTAGVLAAVALSACLLLGLAWLAPLAAQAQDLRGRLERAARHAGIAPTNAAPDPGLASAEQLARFRQRFPRGREMAAVFGRIHAIATARGLALPQADFKLGPAADEALARYVIQLPIRGDYRTLRGFMAEVLRTVPEVALEEVVLRRDDAKSPLVDARLRLVMFVSVAD